MDSFPGRLQKVFLDRLRGWLGSSTSFRARRNANVLKPLEQIDVSLAKPKPKETLSRVTAAPPGQCTYAIGDVHGRFDLLEQLIATIEADATLLPASTQVSVVFLGDYVDRGLQSRDVINLFISGKLDDLNPVFLKGNHEEALLRFLSDAEFGPQWARYGGGETLFSYGLQPPNTRASLASHEAMAAVRDGWSRVWNEFKVKLPDSHWHFLESLKDYHVAGDYLFVHAGLRPGRDIGDQTQRDMLWIRDEFLDAPDAFAHLIVHGHTPMDAVHHDNRRIGLDTGAFITGKLSAVRLFGTEIAFLST
jgi:serine/threonine protein phosphatase 1